MDELSYFTLKILLRFHFFRFPDFQTIIMINQKGNDILGWTKGELIGENWFENCIPPQDRERVKEYFKKLVKGEVDVVPFYEIY